MSRDGASPDMEVLSTTLDIISSGLQQIGCLQILSDDGIQDDLHDHLNVRGVCCRGEMRVDDFALGQVALQEFALNETGSYVYLTVWTQGGGEERCVCVCVCVCVCDEN